MCNAPKKIIVYVFKINVYWSFSCNGHHAEPLINSDYHIQEMKSVNEGMLVN
jgi:hypothetical protein